jgi:hypothetical protein
MKGKCEREQARNRWLRGRTTGSEGLTEGSIVRGTKPAEECYYRIVVGSVETRYRGQQLVSVLDRTIRHIPTTLALLRARQ